MPVPLPTRPIWPGGRQRPRGGCAGAAPRTPGGKAGSHSLSCTPGARSGAGTTPHCAPAAGFEGAGWLPAPEGPPDSALLHPRSPAPLRCAPQPRFTRTPRQAPPAAPQPPLPPVRPGAGAASRCLGEEGPELEGLGVGWTGPGRWVALSGGRGCEAHSGRAGRTPGGRRRLWSPPRARLHFPPWPRLAPRSAPFSSPWALGSRAGLCPRDEEKGGGTRGGEGKGRRRKGDGPSLGGC